MKQTTVHVLVFLFVLFFLGVACSHAETGQDYTPLLPDRDWPREELKTIKTNINDWKIETWLAEQIKHDGIKPEFISKVPEGNPGLLGFTIAVFEDKYSNVDIIRKSIEIADGITHYHYIYVGWTKVVRDNQIKKKVCIIYLKK